jgi:hypothetical protein
MLSTKSFVQKRERGEGQSGDKEEKDDEYDGCAAVLVTHILPACLAPRLDYCVSVSRSSKQQK